MRRLPGREHTLRLAGRVALGLPLLLLVGLMIVPGAASLGHVDKDPTATRGGIDGHRRDIDVTV